jgi:hypothetical protein
MYVRYMMHHIGEDDRPQRCVSERHLQRICHNLDRGAVERLGSNQTRNKAIAISGPGAQLQNGPFYGRQPSPQSAVPFIVNCTKKGLRGNDLAPQLGRCGIV